MKTTTIVRNYNWLKDYNKYFGVSPTLKYHNKKATADEIIFDSIKERDRYLVLKDMKKCKEIKELELQKRFELQPEFVDNLKRKHRPIYYIADFFYYDNKLKCYVAEDVKSKATKEDKVYKIKSKMFMYKYPNILFKEII